MNDPVSEPTPPTAPATPTARRRWLLLAGAAGVAAAGGVGLQRWREARAAEDAARRAEAEAALAAQTGGFWTMSFPTLDGGTLATASLRGQPLLLNFWGTWCPPCVKEMPELDRFAAETAGRWRVLGLAVDNPKAVREFLARTPVRYAIAMAGFDGAQLTRELGNAAGGLPFTVAFDAEGRITHRKAGATTLEELRGWL